MDYNKKSRKCTNKVEHLETGTLFEDEDFPATDESMFYSRPPGSEITWMRPGEICDDPKFIVDGTSRFDLDQGDLGNCWFVAAAATVASKPQLLEKVVPLDQNFQTDYAGIFRFYFWRYGQWEEVVVDDRLPVKYGKYLMFSKNKEQPNEFWCALMEKAYAKMYGSYEALQGGKIQDGLVDMTGGAGEVISLVDKSKLPRKLFSFLNDMHSMNSLMGCAITSDGVKTLSNGLVCGHAYSITGLARFEHYGKKVRLLRLRNPWGEKEWNGAWSDKSSEWDELDEAQIKSLNLTKEEDGEFWMSYYDWRDHFKELQICHLTPQSPILDESRRQWCMSAMDGQWDPGVNAGGCGNPPHEDLYWSNPQCHIELRGTTGCEEQCPLVVSLMHKFRRLLHMKGLARDVIIGYDIYKVKKGVCHEPDTMLAQKDLTLIRRMDISHNYREVCHTFHYPPGHYCIIPATFYPNQEADFYLRVVSETESPMERLEEPSSSVTDDEDLRAIFDRHAGSMGGADAKGLRNILKAVYKKDGFKFTVKQCKTFIIKCCGKGADSLDFGMFSHVKNHLDNWREIYLALDSDNSGTLSLRQTRKAIRQSGIGKIRKPVQEALKDQYGGDGDHFTFGEFAMIVCKLSMAKDAFLSEHGSDENQSMFDEALVAVLA